MASPLDVKTYLACWMQLGTKLFLKGGQSYCQLQKVLVGEHFSNEFENCWSQVLDSSSGDCFLDGSTTTLKELMGQNWEIVDCARCDMPVALPICGLPPEHCPCHGLTSWPNTELPLPRPPVKNSDYLYSLQQRLNR